MATQVVLTECEPYHNPQGRGLYAEGSWNGRVFRMVMGDKNLLTMPKPGAFPFVEEHRDDDLANELARIVYGMYEADELEYYQGGTVTLVVGPGIRYFDAPTKNVLRLSFGWDSTPDERALETERLLLELLNADKQESYVLSNEELVLFVIQLLIKRTLSGYRNNPDTLPRFRRKPLTSEEWFDYTRVKLLYVRGNGEVKVFTFTPKGEYEGEPKYLVQDLFGANYRVVKEYLSLMAPSWAEKEIEDEDEES